PAPPDAKPKAPTKREEPKTSARIETGPIDISIASAPPSPPPTPPPTTPPHPDNTAIATPRGDGDPTMRTALEEAVRAVRLRYPIWEPGHIDLSFAEKSVSHGGPSAGTVFALLMLSTLENF